MRLATMRCTRTSASVLKSCANRLLLASSPDFSWTSMDSSRGLDRHIRATWAAASEARRAHPVRPPLHRRRRSLASVPSSEEDIILWCSHGAHRAKLERDVRVVATTSAGGEKINHCVARYRRRGGGRLRGFACQSTIILLYYTYNAARRRTL